MVEICPHNLSKGSSWPRWEEQARSDKSGWLLSFSLSYLIRTLNKIEEKNDE